MLQARLSLRLSVMDLLLHDGHECLPASPLFLAEADQWAHILSPSCVQRKPLVFRGGSRFLLCRQVRVRCFSCRSDLYEVDARMSACTCVSTKGNMLRESAHVCLEQGEVLVREMGGHKDGYLGCRSGIHVYLSSPSFSTFTMYIPGMALGFPFK